MREPTPDLIAPASVCRIACHFVFENGVLTVHGSLRKQRGWKQRVGTVNLSSCTPPLHTNKRLPLDFFGREAYFLVAGLMNYPFHLKSYICGALFKSVIGITPYLSCFEVERKPKALLRHHLVACLAVPLVAINPLLPGLSIAVGKADGNDIVAWLQQGALGGCGYYSLPISFGDIYNDGVPKHFCEGAVAIYRYL